MNRTEKEAVVAEVSEKISRATGLYFADFRGLTVAEETELRREFRKSGIDYQVVKNTLAKRALQSSEQYDRVAEKLVGPTGIVFAYDDSVAPAKIIKKFSDKTGKFKLKAAVVEKQVYDGSQLGQLASVPSKPELMASILGSLQSPISGIVGALNAVMRDLVSVVDAIEKKKAA
ncbi:MAG: 50S ribosomal protein L10 [Ignavibacteria bacterium]|nr:50S ribosomal protein L10 [Ignavibacteria bacterium]